MGRLTYDEIGLLISAHNREEENKSRANKSVKK
jgi:hypothetical protein